MFILQFMCVIFSPVSKGVWGCVGVCALHMCASVWVHVFRIWQLTVWSCQQVWRYEMRRRGRGDVIRWRLRQGEEAERQTNKLYNNKERVRTPLGEVRRGGGAGPRGKAVSLPQGNPCMKPGTASEVDLYYQQLSWVLITGAEERKSTVMEFGKKTLTG